MSATKMQQFEGRDHFGGLSGLGKHRVREAFLSISNHPKNNTIITHKNKLSHSTFYVTYIVPSTWIHYLI